MEIKYACVIVIVSLVKKLTAQPVFANHATVLVIANYLAFFN